MRTSLIAGMMVLLTACDDTNIARDLTFAVIGLIAVVMAITMSVLTKNRGW